MPSAGPAIGIDLGTTYSCVAVYLNGKVEVITNDQGSRTTPSYVAFTQHERLVGEAAVHQAARNATNTIFDSKRLIGRRFQDEIVQRNLKHWPFRVVDNDGRPSIEVVDQDEQRNVSPETISAMILQKLKDTAEAYLSQKVSEAVITVPASFNDAQRAATKAAAGVAGLNVLRIINEPTAGAIAYGFDKDLADNRHVLVYDLGGGTFDVSILTMCNKEFRVLATVGDPHLGGEDFDNRLVDHFVAEFQRDHAKDLSKNKRALRRLRTECERAKRVLSSATVVAVEIDSLFDGVDLVTKITRARFEDLCRDLFDSTLDAVKQALSDAGVAKEDIAQIVLVGGSSRIPYVERRLLDFFSGRDLSRSINFDEAVAYGAALQAAALSNHVAQAIRPLNLIDVVQLSLGIETAGGIMTTLIRRNTPIPASQTRMFSTLSLNQQGVGIVVYEGERALTKDNHLLGRFRLQLPSPMSAVGEKPQIEVTFSVDPNGMLSVTAVDKSSSSCRLIVISNDDRRLLDDDIENLVREAKQHEGKDAACKRLIAARNDLQLFCSRVREALKKVPDSEQKKRSYSYVSETLAWTNTHTVNDIAEYSERRKEIEQYIKTLNLF